MRDDLPLTVRIVIWLTWPWFYVGALVSRIVRRGD